MLDDVNPDRVIAVAERAYATGALTIAERVRMAQLLENFEKYERSYQLAKECVGSDEVDDPERRGNALGSAGRSALKLGKKEEAVQLLSEIPISQLRGHLGEIAIQQKLETGDAKAAFELAKIILASGLDARVIRVALEVSQKLGQRREFE